MTFDESASCYVLSAYCLFHLPTILQARNGKGLHPGESATPLGQCQLLEGEVAWQHHLILIGNLALLQVQGLQGCWQVSKLCQHITPQLEMLQCWQAPDLQNIILSLAFEGQTCRAASLLAPTSMSVSRHIWCSRACSVHKGHTLHHLSMRHMAECQLESPANGVRNLRLVECFMPPSHNGTRKYSIGKMLIPLKTHPA